MSKRLSCEPVAIEVVYSSTAERARLFAKEIQKTCDAALELHQDLYTFSTEQLLSFIKSIPASVQNAVVVAHNPAITRLANQLGQKGIENVPTAGLVRLDLSADTWNEISEMNTRLIWMDTPKSPKSKIES